MTTEPLGREQAPIGRTPNETGPVNVGRARILPTLLVATPVVLLVLTAYVWLVTTGTWSIWPQPYNYSHYDKLASAFSRGQLFLDVKPDPALLALADPYDPASRQQLPYLIDASLYRGKYYLYFGPVPALLLLIPKLFIPRVIGDIYLVFAFICAVFLIETIFILRIRERFFPGIPAWLAGVCVLFLGLSTPFGWILVGDAAVHNAAIAAGQFFFLAGLYMAFEALAEEPVNRKKALAAGILWAAAFGSRITQSVPIAVVVLLVLVNVVQRQSRSRRFPRMARDSAAFVGPLILGAATLGWYNWARFGSVLESGLSYQLAMLPMQRYAKDLFSIQYVLQNLYNYMLMPPRLRYAFPYVWPQTGLRDPIVPGSSLSPLYFTEETTGLVYSVPFLIYILGAVVGWRSRGAGVARAEADRSLLPWLEIALGAAFVSGFSVFLAFFWASNRYLLDFLPPALLLSVIGFWQMREALRTRPLMRGIVVAVGLVLIGASLVGSALLTIGEAAVGFSALNPTLWAHLNKLFRGTDLWKQLMNLFRP